jgi:hypothetical protein
MIPAAGDLIPHIVLQYDAGAITAGEACLHVLMAAGEGDAEATFVRLPRWLRDACSRASPMRTRVRLGSSNPIVEPRPTMLIWPTFGVGKAYCGAGSSSYNV